MKLIQLRYLVAVAENDLNITQAARALVRPTSAGNKVIDQAWAGLRRGALLRGFMYDFLQMFAPHLTPRQVQTAENAETQEDVERVFSGVKIPFLR